MAKKSTTVTKQKIKNKVSVGEERILGPLEGKEHMIVGTAHEIISKLLAVEFTTVGIGPTISASELFLLNVTIRNKADYAVPKIIFRDIKVKLKSNSEFANFIDQTSMAQSTSKDIAIDELGNKKSKTFKFTMICRNGTDAPKELVANFNLTSKFDYDKFFECSFSGYAYADLVP